MPKRVWKTTKLTVRVPLPFRAVPPMEKFVICEATEAFGHFPRGTSREETNERRNKGCPLGVVPTGGTVRIPIGKIVGERVEVETEFREITEDWELGCPPDPIRLS